jgi:pyruvate formate lyase activating enzyme
MSAPYNFSPRPFFGRKAVSLSHALLRSELRVGGSLKPGIVFDIKEFSVHDGPGIRTTVFMKGCPLSCMWCHNPEGQSYQPQWMHSPAGNRLAGTEYSPEELAALLNRYGPILSANEGGVTFSGGEPLAQAAFITEVIDRLDGLHVLLDTSGYGAEEDLRQLLGRVDLVYFDLKLVDPLLHARYTGRDNALILHSLTVLSESSVPFVLRVPLVPGVTDTQENLSAIAEVAKGLSGLERVDLLPYNRAAGAKYEPAGKVFRPDYDESQPVNVNTRLFERRGVKVRVA